MKRPARLSETPRTISGAALPRMRNRHGRGAAIRKHPEHVVEFRPALDLVQYNQALEAAQGAFGIGEDCIVGPALEVEEVGVKAAGDHAGQRGLSALPRSDQDHGRIAGEPPANDAGNSAGDHILNYRI